MRIGVLSASEGWHLRDLQRAAVSGGHEILPLDYRRLAATVDARGEDFAAGEHGLAELDALLVRAMPAGSLEQVIFRMDVLGRVEARGVAVVNPPAAIECAVDKYLALARLSDAGLPVPRTRACEDAERALEDFESLGGNVVVKPLFGSEGRGMLRLTDRDLARRAFTTLERLGAVIYQQEFIESPGWDCRVLLAGDAVLGTIKRRPPRLEDASPGWKSNTSCGGSAESFAPGEELVNLAREAARTVSAPLAGVDLIPDIHGRFHVLELNAAPGWRAMSRVTDLDVAAGVLRFVESHARRDSDGPSRRARS